MFEVAGPLHFFKCLKFESSLSKILISSVYIRFAVENSIIFDVTKNDPFDTTF